MVGKECLANGPYHVNWTCIFLDSYIFLFNKNTKGQNIIVMSKCKTFYIPPSQICLHMRLVRKQIEIFQAINSSEPHIFCFSFMEKVTFCARMLIFLLVSVQCCTFRHCFNTKLQRFSETGYKSLREQVSWSSRLILKFKSNLFQLYFSPLTNYHLSHWYLNVCILNSSNDFYSSPMGNYLWWGDLDIIIT